MNSGQYFNNDRGKRARIMFVEDLDTLGQPRTSATLHELDMTEDSFKETLLRSPLNDLEREVLYYRFINGLTFKRISEVLNFVGGARKVSDVYRRSLTKMKEFYANDS